MKLSKILVQVDELMERRGARLRGGGHISALEVEHEGFQLYPILPDQADQFSSLQTAAAFVSNQLMASESACEQC